MSQANASDEWVMDQVADGKREHLETLVRRYASPLLTFIERMVGDRHHAEEVFQDVFLAVWSKRRTYQPPCPFRSWLFAIAANRCRELHRRSSPAVVYPPGGPSDTILVDSGPTPVEVAVAAETASLVDVAVRKLPTQQRTVVILRNWNGLSFAQIGEVVGCSEATARSHMHHALAGIRRYLEPRLPNRDAEA